MYARPLRMSCRIEAATRTSGWDEFLVWTSVYSLTTVETEVMWTPLAKGWNLTAIGIVSPAANALSRRASREDGRQRRPANHTCL